MKNTAELALVLLLCWLGGVATALALIAWWGRNGRAW